MESNCFSRDATLTSDSESLFSRTLILLSCGHRLLHIVQMHHNVFIQMCLHILQLDTGSTVESAFLDLFGAFAFVFYQGTSGKRLCAMFTHKWHVSAYRVVASYCHFRPEEVSTIALKTAQYALVFAHFLVG